MAGLGRFLQPKTLATSSSIGVVLALRMFGAVGSRKEVRSTT